MGRSGLDRNGKNRVNNRKNFTKFTENLLYYNRGWSILEISRIEFITSEEAETEMMLIHIVKAVSLGIAILFSSVNICRAISHQATPAANYVVLSVGWALFWAL